MRHIINILVIAILTLGIGGYVRYSNTSNLRLMGTVLRVEEGQALVSKRTDLKEEDLLKTQDEWLFENYDLIYVSPLHDVEPGVKISFVVQGTITSSYPAHAQLKSYEIIE